MNIALRIKAQNIKLDLQWFFRELVRSFKARCAAQARGFKLPKVFHLEPIPAEENPFWHDSFNMGTDLVRGWMVMHEGPDRTDSPRNLNFVILVNQRTGQRIRVDLRPTHSQKEK